MSEKIISDDLIEVEVFAKQKGLATDKVIAMIKDGFYVGRIIDEQWYVETSELSKTSKSNKNKKVVKYNSDYVVARRVSSFISLLGWLLFVLGVITSIVGLISVGSIIAFAPGLGIAVSGLILIVAAQVTRATVDNADHTREILKLIKEKA